MKNPKWMQENTSQLPHTATTAGGKKHPLDLGARSSHWPHTDADRRDYFSPELQKFGVSGLPLSPALCSWEWDSPGPGKSPLSHISMRRKGGKRNKDNTYNQTQVCDLSAQSGSFCEKGLPRIMRVISQWLFYNGNNLIKHRAFHGVGAALNGGDWNGVCRTEIRCVLYQHCSCSEIWLCPRNWGAKIISVRGGTAPSSAT